MLKKVLFWCFIVFVGGLYILISHPDNDFGGILILVSIVVSVSAAIFAYVFSNKKTVQQVATSQTPPPLQTAKPEILESDASTQAADSAPAPTPKTLGESGEEGDEKGGCTALISIAIGVALLGYVFWPSGWFNGSGSIGKHFELKEASCDWTLYSAVDAYVPEAILTIRNDGAAISSSFVVRVVFFDGDGNIKGDPVLELLNGGFPKGTQRGPLTFTGFDAQAPIMQLGPKAEGPKAENRKRLDPPTNWTFRVEAAESAVGPWRQFGEGKVTIPKPIFH